MGKIKDSTSDDIFIETGEIFSVGEINEDFYLRLMKNISIMEANKKNAITIYLNSPGGDVSMSLGLYDRISSYKYPVTIKVFGEVCSGASIILQAADVRYMSKHSILMIHDISLDCVAGHIKSVNSYVNSTKTQSEQMIDIFLNRGCKLNKTQLKYKFQHDWFLSPDEALELGLIDERA